MQAVLAWVAAYAAFLVAGLTTAISIRHGTFVAWGTDAAGYVGAARRWAEGRLFNPAPFQLWATWPHADLTITPLSYRLSPIRGTDVSQYPLGFPVLLAAADRVDHELGVYFVAPLFAGVLVWCTFLLGRRLAGPCGGLVAAILMAVSPVTLAYAVTPMSDVPCAAFFALALEMSLRRSTMGAAAAGAAIAAAVMIRPVVAPLAIVPAALLLTGDAAAATAWREWRWSRALIFSAFAAIGPLMVGWSQHELYGSFFTPGYLAAQAFFKTEHIAQNILLYPRHLASVLTPLVFVGLIGALASLVYPPEDRERRRLWIALLAVVALNYAIYLPYLPYDDPAYLRFLLPAIGAMFILLAAAIVRVAEVAALHGSRRWLVAAIAVPLSIPSAIVYKAVQQLPLAFIHAEHQAYIRVMGRYLAEALPANAVVITFIHSAAVTHYTGKPILRFDLIEPHLLEPTLDTLVRRGYRPVFVIDHNVEGHIYETRFASSPIPRLDWRPRALIAGGSVVSYYDYADRGKSADRTRAPIDVLR